MTPRAQPRSTYTTFLIHTIMPAPGWQGVWWFEDHHEALPVHALALVTRTTRDLHSNEALTQYADELEEDRREIVGMEYNPSDGWGVCDDVSNYCGLLPPGWTLEAFEGYHNPATYHKKQEAV